MRRPIINGRRSAAHRRASALTVPAMVLAALLGSCLQPLDTFQSSRASEPGERAQATLTLRVGGGASTQTVTPDEEMQPASYLLVGSGPDGAAFEVESSDGSASVTNIEAGSWTIEARALNTQSFLVGHGEKEATLEADTNTSVSIPVQPVDGLGTLTIRAQWNGAHTVSPSVEATLTDAYGNAADFGVPVTTSGEASVTRSDVPAGYHMLSLRLVDSGSVVMGALESVRIAADAVTAADIQMNDINKVGEAVTVTNDQFVMAWDPPTEGGTVESYNVYVRDRGTYEWSLLTEVDAMSTPQLTVTHSLLPYGSYEFAVSSVNSTGESDKHSSMDDDAQPSTGWYVEWVGP